METSTRLEYFRKVQSKSLPEIYIELILNRLKQWGVQISSLVKERRGLVASGRAEDPLEGARGVEGRQTTSYQPTSESVGWQNFGKTLLVFGCTGSDFCK